MKAKHRQLKEISQIRQLQVAASEARVASAQRQCDALEVEQGQICDKQRDALAAWSGHAGGGRLDLTLALAWSDLFGQMEAQRVSIEAQVWQAQSTLALARDNWRSSQARYDASNRQVRRFETMTRRHADEQALAAAADLWPYLEARL